MSTSTPAAIALVELPGGMSAGAAIAIGAAIGLVVGIVVGLGTDVPLAPEGGLAIGALGGWLSQRSRG